MTNRGYIVCVVLLVLARLAAGGQEADTLPKLYPSSVTVYDIDRGMPISCLTELFVDPGGRLFVNPCRFLDIHQNLNFYQFDGNKSHIVALEAPDGKTAPLGWGLKGITAGGLLFGTDADGRHAFLYNPDNGAKQIYAFDNAGRVRAMIAGPGNEALVLAYAPDAYSLFRLRPEGKKMLTRIPVEEEFVPGGAIPALRSGDQVWFIHSNIGFFRYSLTDNRLKRYNWPDLPGAVIKEYPGFTGDWTNLDMALAPAGEILFYIHGLSGFFVFDPVSEQLARQPQLNAYLRRLGRSGNVNVQFHRDARENLLVNFSWLPDEVAGPGAKEDLLAAVLWDHNGQFFDYQLVAKMNYAGRYKIASGFFCQSRDFKKQVLSATSGGLIAVEIKASLSIKAGLKGWASRAMGMLDKNRVLALSENGYKAILDLRTMESEILTYKQAAHPLFVARNFGQLVSVGDELWFPTNNGQLACYQRSDQSSRYYEIGQEFDKFNFIGPQEIAFANTRNEVFRYGLARGESRPFLKGGAPLQIGGTVNEMAVGRNGILWIASLNGLWRIDPRTGASQRLGKADGLADDRFLCIHEADDGELWLGTLGSGLQFYHPETGAMRSLDRSKGLSNNTVAGILSDEDGDRWVSTFNGLTAVSKEGKVLFNLSEEEGLPHREFNRYSYLKAGDGRLLFGGVDGVALLGPEQIKAAYAQKDSLKIYLTDVRYHDQASNSEVHLTTGFHQPGRIVLPAAHRYIKLDFGLSDFLNPDKNTFAYRFRHDGSADDADAIWTEIGSGSELLLNDLPAGSYTILIRGTNAKGQVTEKPLAMPVRVREFFYKTWWFYALCALPFLLGAFFWIRRLQTERQRLEAEVASRTQQIRRDKELIEEQATKLQALDELKSRFFTNISHEFRTPLTVISGMATQIRQQPEQWLEKGMELIQRNSRQLLSLINQILDLRRLESGAMKVNLVQGDIIPYLRYIAESFVRLAQARGLRLHVLAGTEAVDMDYDPEKMMHILSNLLSNAIKYTPAPGDIYLRIGRQHDEAGREQLSIQVQDTGPGMAPEVLPYIFDRFYQAPSQPAPKEDERRNSPPSEGLGGAGSGVGLALARELAQLLNGTIEVSSAPGAGTAFTLSFPITREARVQESQIIPETESHAQATAPQPVVAKEPAVPAAEAIDGNLQGSAGQPSLLIVEDNADVRLYLTACLEKHYRLLVAENGQEGIDRAIELVPDLIVSDVMMPAKDGFELCDTLKKDERTSHIPIVLLTARADFESKMTGLRKGADAYLPKPFEQEELLVRLEQLLALRKKLQERYRNLSSVPEHPISEDFRIEDAFIRKLRKLVIDNISDEKMDVHFLCKSLAVSRTQLHNKVTALTGQSATRFVRLIRLNKARELLQTTRLNVSEVAYEVGFSNPAYFSRIYAEAFGEAPRQTRK
ncbi:MAG: response regulator [Phaeodactylibacter sp.]|nr:response regulator [Phaeodactylibacter sp.]